MIDGMAAGPRGGMGAVIGGVAIIADGGGVAVGTESASYSWIVSKSSR